MEQTLPNINLKQREMFARLLTQAKERTQEELESDYTVDQRVEAEELPKLAEEHGANELISKVRTLRKELENAETALRKLGFSCDDDDFSIVHDAPKAMTEALATAKRSARRERDKVLKNYDLGILGVWASEDAREARKIVEGVS